MSSDNNIGIYSSSSFSPTDSSSSATSSFSSTTTIKMVEVKDLSDKEKQEMRRLCLDPQNSSDVATYRAMSPADIQCIIDGGSELGQNPSPNNNTLASSGTDEHFHSFNIDTNSEEWKGMRFDEKVNFVIRTGASAKYGDKWETMSLRERRIAENAYVEEELNAHIEGFKGLTTSQKLDKLSDILNFAAIADENDLGLKELLELRENNKEQFASLEKKYYKSHKQIDLLNLRNTFIADYVNSEKTYYDGLNDFCKDSNKPVTAQSQLEYLEQKTDRTKYENYLYKRLSEAKEVIGDNFDLIPSGTKSVYDILTEDEFYSLPQDNGEPDYEKSKDQVYTLVANKILSCKNEEEFNNYIKDLKPQEFLQLASVINKSDMSPEFKELWAKYAKTVDLPGNLVLSASVKATGKSMSADAQECIASSGMATNMRAQLREIGRDTSAADELDEAIGENFSKENVALSQETAANAGDKESIYFTNKGVENRGDDRQDVREYLNDFWANSDTISDEMKEYYAQSSIEVIKSPQDRQAQANSLGKYNLDSFNTGVQKGYENIANGTAGSSSSSTYSTVNNVTNPITNSNLQVISPNSKQVINEIVSYKPGEQIDYNEAIKFFKKLDINEQREVLLALTPQQVSQIPITVCNTFPELINTFIDLGKGIDIIDQCNVNTSNRAIQTMAKSKGSAKKQFNDWAANHTERLAKCTYDLLVASGSIENRNVNKGFYAKG